MMSFSLSGGVEVVGFISPTDPLDTYPVIDPLYGIDGFRNVNNLTELNSISYSRRRAGMVVGVSGGTVYYKLNPAPWNGTTTDWSIFNSGTGSVFTGGTVVGPTIFTNGLSANTLSVNGVVITGDTYTTGGTYSNGVLDFQYNTGGGYQISGLTDNNTFTTGFSYNNNTFLISDNSGTTLSATIDSVTGLTINGDLIVTGNTTLQSLTATTISAATYLNLPEEILKFTSISNFPLTGSTNYLYLDQTESNLYAWDTSLPAPGGYTLLNSQNPPLPPDVLPLTFVQAATVGALSNNPVYYNGPLNDGVGAILSGTTNGLISDGSSLGRIDFTYTGTSGDTILIKNQIITANPLTNKGFQNGLYTIVDPGSVSSPYILTRVSDFDESSELYPLQVNVLGGSNNSLKYFIQTTINPVIGTSNIVFAISSQQNIVYQISFVDTATSSALPSSVYTSGTTFPTIPGNGATLTAQSPGGPLIIDGMSASTSTLPNNTFNRLLVKDQVGPLAYQNGDYVVINPGSPSARWQLRRINTSSGGFDRYTRFFIVSNTQSPKAGKFYFTTKNVPPLTNLTIGTAPINIVEYGGGNTFTGGTVSGSTTFLNGLTATTISAATYLNLPSFTGITGGGQPGQVAFYDTTTSISGNTNLTYSGGTFQIVSSGNTFSDIPFRIRNSGGTDNITTINGDGSFKIGLANGYHINLTANSPSLRGQLASTVAWQLSPWTGENSWLTSNPNNLILVGVGTTTPTDKLHIFNNVNDYRIRIAVAAGSPADESCGIRFTTTWAGTSFGSDAANLVVRTKGTAATSTQRTALEFRMNSQGTSALRGSLTSQSNLLLQSPTEDTNDVGVIYIPNGTTPTTSITGGSKFYSANIPGGNAAPHFRTENGNIVKLYTYSAVTSAQGIADALTTLGLLSASTITSISGNTNLNIMSTSGVSSSALTLDININYYGVNHIGNVDITLPNPTGYDGYNINIKDESGNASIYRIRLTPSSGLIDGTTYVDMNTNYMSLHIVARNNNWWII